LPVYLTTPEGWLRFYQLNLSRGSDWGSLWYALTSLGVNLPSLNYLSILFLLIGFAAIAIYIFELRNTPSLASLSFIVLATVMCASKVYSPQYALWLIPLAVIALSDKRDLHAFWIWQGAEVIYHIAIWQHLAERHWCKVWFAALRIRANYLASNSRHYLSDRDIRPQGPGRRHPGPSCPQIPA
jgi:uncharacterized membrane protein